MRSKDCQHSNITLHHHHSHLITFDQKYKALKRAKYFMDFHSKFFIYLNGWEMIFDVCNSLNCIYTLDFAYHAQRLDVWCYANVSFYIMICHIMITIFERHEILLSCSFRAPKNCPADTCWNKWRISNTEFVHFFFGALESPYLLI